MAINERQYFGFKRTVGDASRVDSNSRGVPAIIVPTTDRDVHLASAADERTDWNVSNPSHPTLYVHSETTPATDYISLAHDGTTATFTIAGGNYVTLCGGDLVVANTYGVIVGATSQITISDGDGATDLIPEVQVLGTTKTDSSLLLASFNTTNDATVAPSLNLLKSGNAAIGANTTVASGEILGQITAFGADGTDFESAAARISFEVDSTVGTGDMPGRMLFLTTSDGGETLAEAMRITSTQDVYINNCVGLIVGRAGGGLITVSDGDGATNLIPEVQVLGTAKADSSVLIASFNTTNDSTVAPSLNFLKSGHATIGSNTIVACGEILGEINFFGADGTDFESAAASIRAVVNAAPGVGDMPGRLSLFTTSDGAETLVERARLSGTATASTLAVGVAGATTGALTLAGTTSGVVTLTVAAAAGTFTLELPATDGCCGQQLTTNGSGVLTWGAASLAEYKTDLGELCANEALDAIVSTPVHKFTYNQNTIPAGQWAPEYEFTGIYGEEAPWAMQGKNKRVFSPINSFGYAAAAIQALNDKIEKLEERLGE